jgi:beta-aspartyl-peptidase (threonine type)
MTTPNTLGRLLLAGVALCCGLSRTTADAGDAAGAAIRKVLDDQEAAWNRGDLEGFMAGYWKSPELTFYSGRDKQQGWQAAYDRYKARYQAPGKSMGQVGFSEVTIERIADDAALVRGRWKVKLPNGETPDGLFSLVMRKKPEGWRIVHDHTSAGEAPAPAGKKPDGQ